MMVNQPFQILPCTQNLWGNLSNTGKSNQQIWTKHTEWTQPAQVWIWANDQWAHEGAIAPTLGGREAFGAYPAGSMSSLYLMYIAFQRISHSKPASRSTFYVVAKQWSCCLRFRRKCEHAMCATCQSLKSQTHAATDLCQPQQFLSVAVIFVCSGLFWWVWLNMA